MPCYTPLSAFEIISKRDKKTNGKRNIVFKRPDWTIYREVQLPCGQCIGCRLLRSIGWANRIMHESTLHDENCFITLTYDDEHLPNDYSLNKHHFTAFLKKLRRYISPAKIRYFMAGEYGDESWRPHYHAIIFGWDFSRSIKYGKNFYGKRQVVQNVETANSYYISPLLSALWPFGFHLVANCTWETAAYVARYVVKKVNGERSEFHYNRNIIDWNEFTGEIYEFREVQLEPEYARMSTHPGIGHAWFNKFSSDCYPSDYLIKDGKKLPVPKYYDKLLEKRDSDLFNAVKVRRELQLLLHKDDLTPERLRQRHNTKIQQNKSLKRRKV